MFAVYELMQMGGASLVIKWIHIKVAALPDTATKKKIISNSKVLNVFKILGEI